MSMAAHRPAPYTSPRTNPVYAILVTLLLGGISISAHGDYDFNNPNAVVVPATKPSQFDDYEARSRAREEAWEHDRAERQRADEARQLMYDQQQRERNQASYQEPSTATRTDTLANTVPQYPQTFTYGPRKTPEPPSTSGDYVKGFGLIIFIVLMIAWFMRDAAFVNPMRNPSRHSRVALRNPASTPINAAATTNPAVAEPNRDAAKPIDFHPVSTPHAPQNPFNALAEQTLAAFAAEPSRDPVVFGTQLKKAQLDYSAASLARVDHFLRQLRSQTNPDFSQYVSQEDHRHLLIVLGFYIGTTIARLTQQNITWYDLAGAKQHLSNSELPDSIQTRYSCMIGERYHLLPIDLVCNMLFAETPSESCAAKLAFYQQNQ